MLESGRPRQAVVLIHGIGEQRPMDTLRAFADGLGLGPWYSKPDRLSESFELRRYTFPGRRDVRPPTDCYELYWAHHFDEGNIRETLAWSARLVTRRPFWRVNRTLRPMMAVVQILGVLALLLLTAGVVVAIRQGQLSSFFGAWQTWGALLLIAAQLVAGGFVRRTLADAARYLTPRPSNVESRNRIRAEGITLLRRLHESGQYQRVVVVGHSLGSVIGYDVLRALWDELRHPDGERSGKQPEAKSGFDEVADALAGSADPAQTNRAAPAGVDPDLLTAFQQAQHRLWRENRARGVPWLVTDFVTLGSPLAHAPLLLDSRRATLAMRQVEREYPTCPPQADPVDQTRFYYERLSAAGQPRSMLVGNVGAPFGPTRWTNLYVPVRRLVQGDLVGGPVSTVFGPGVRDIPVRPPEGGRVAWARRWFPFAHTSYWTAPAADQDQPPSPDRLARRATDRRTGTHDALASLRGALSLDLFRSKTPYPPPDRPVGLPIHTVRPDPPKSP